VNDALDPLTRPVVLNLVERVQQGDPEAAGALYDRFHLRIFRYIWARVNDRQTAEDLTGEVFVRMVAQLPAYQVTGAPFEAWLYRIARNLVIDNQRKRGQYLAVDLTNAEGVQTSEGNPATLVESALMIERLALALRNLDPVQAEVIRLRFLAGLSIKETAASLEKSVAAVKALQYRGLATLREQIVELMQD